MNDIFLTVFLLCVLITIMINIDKSIIILFSCVRQWLHEWFFNSYSPVWFWLLMANSHNSPVWICNWYGFYISFSLSILDHSSMLHLFGSTLISAYFWQCSCYDKGCSPHVSLSEASPKSFLEVINDALSVNFILHFTSVLFHTQLLFWWPNWSICL